MSSVRAFTALSWHVMLGRGKVAVVVLDRDSDRDSLLTELQRDGVQIDGEPFHVIGVEAFAIPTLTAGTRIGLLVKP